MFVFHSLAFHIGIIDVASMKQMDDLLP